MKCRNDAEWFLYLILKPFFVGPMYVSVVLLSLRVTVALQITIDWRQYPLSGHGIFCRQLQVLLSFVLFAVSSALSSICSDEYKMRLLWLSIICLVLFMQLQLILMVLRLQIFQSLWYLGKCLSTRARICVRSWCLGQMKVNVVEHGQRRVDEG